MGKASRTKPKESIEQWSGRVANTAMAIRQLLADKKKMLEIKNKVNNVPEKSMD